MKKVGLNPKTTVMNDFNGTQFELKSSSLESADRAILCVILSLAVLSNTCLIVLESKVWLKRKRLSQPRLLIIFLAFIDAISCVFGIIPRLLLANRSPCLTSILADMYMLTRFVFGCFSILSKLTVVLMGIERFISIRAPFFYVRHCTVKMFATIQLGLVLYSLLIGATVVFLDRGLFTEIRDDIPHFETLNCHGIFLVFEFGIYPKRTLMPWRYSSISNGFTVFQLMQDFVLIIILFICNTSVICGLGDMERRLRRSCPRSTEERSNAQDLMAATGKEFSRLMIAINIIVVVLTTPNMIRTLCNHFDMASSQIADFVCHHVALCSAFVNPFLYGLLRRKLRRNMRVQLSKWCLWCRPNDVSPSEVTRVTDSHMRIQK